MDVKKIILDCDPGMDDSMAIVMACKSEALDVLAITTVNGNYPVDVTSKNALKVLEMIGRTDIPAGACLSPWCAGPPATRSPTGRTARRRISCRSQRRPSARRTRCS